MQLRRWRHLLDNQVVLIVLILAFCVPLMFTGPSSLRSHQAVGYGVLGLGLLTAWILRAHERLSWASCRRVLTSGPNLPICLYLLLTVLLLPFSVEGFYSREAALQLACGVLVYFTVVYEFRRAPQLQSLLSCLLAIGVVVVVAALVMHGEGRLTRFAGTLHDHQLLGGFLALLLPVVVGIASGTKDGRRRLLAQAGALLLALGLVLSGCRSAWVGALVGLGIFVWLSLRFVWDRDRVRKLKHRLVLTPLLAALALGAFVFATQRGGTLGERAASLANAAQESSFTDRLARWQAAGQVIAARPVTGWGAGAYAFALSEVRPAATRTPALMRREGPSLSESPHNSYLQIAAEHGLGGLALYLMALAMFFVTGWRALQRTQPGLRQLILIGALAAIAGQCVDALSNPGWAFPELSLHLWLVLGLGMRAAGLADHAEAPAPVGETVPAGLPASLVRAARPVLAGAGALLVGVHLFQLELASPAFALDGGQAPLIPIYFGGGTGTDPGAPQIAVIGSLGAAAGAAVAPGLFFGAAPGRGGGAGIFAACDPCDCRELKPNLPDDHGELLAARVRETGRTIEAGYCRCFHLEVKSRRDNRWYSVTHRPESTLFVKDQQDLLVRRYGRKNQFCVPLATPHSADGTMVEVAGAYALPGRPVLTAAAQVKIKIPDEELPTLPAELTQIDLIRLEPVRKQEKPLRMAPSCCRRLRVRVHSSVDGKWYDVSRRAETLWQLSEHEGCLVKQGEGSNVFCVPEGAPRRCDERLIRVSATFTPPMGAPLTAETWVRVNVADDESGDDTHDKDGRLLTPEEREKRRKERHGRGCY